MGVKKFLAVLIAALMIAGFALPDEALCGYSQAGKHKYDFKIEMSEESIDQLIDQIDKQPRAKKFQDKELEQMSRELKQMMKEIEEQQKQLDQQEKEINKRLEKANEQLREFQELEKQMKEKPLPEYVK